MTSFDADGFLDELSQRQKRAREITEQISKINRDLDYHMQQIRAISHALHERHELLRHITKSPYNSRAKEQK